MSRSLPNYLRSSNLRPTKVLIHIINTLDVRIETIKIEEKELSDKIAEIIGGYSTMVDVIEPSDALYVNDNGANDPALADYMFTVPPNQKPFFGKGVVAGIPPDDYKQWGYGVDAVTDCDWLLWNVKLVREFVPSTGKVVKAIPFAQQHPSDWPAEGPLRRITDPESK
jgi:hypothetical protein